MKKDLKEIYSKTEKELRDLVKEKREELFRLNLDLRQNKLKNTRSIFNTRKEIARLLTLIREKELVLRQAPPEADRQDKTPKEAKQL
ncbi:MAG: 50S ribosomal protein L29 [Microgenomates group bacterium GW2011_GWA2_37_6]|nr:MAG: 50S ribosomal protein L29 [Microgenomates group bacterium GW2011_GWA2_37_6]